MLRSEDVMRPTVMRNGIINENRRTRQMLRDHPSRRIRHRLLRPTQGSRCLISASLDAYRFTPHIAFFFIPKSVNRWSNSRFVQFSINYGVQLRLMSISYVVIFISAGSSYRVRGVFALFAQTDLTEKKKLARATSRKPTLISAGSVAPGFPAIRQKT